MEEMTKRLQIEISTSLHNKAWYAYKVMKKKNPDLGFSEYMKNIIETEVEKHYPF